MLSLYLRKADRSAGEKIKCTWLLIELYCKKKLTFELKGEWRKDKNKKLYLIFFFCSIQSKNFNVGVQYIGRKKKRRRKNCTRIRRELTHLDEWMDGWIQDWLCLLQSSQAAMLACVHQMYPQCSQLQVSIIVRVLKKLDEQ